MDITSARSRLATFLGGRTLTFKIKTFEGGEWIAECNEIPAIATGGMGDDISQMDLMIRDAILTAAGVDTQLASESLKFIGYKPTGSLASFFSGSEKAAAEYAVTA